MGLWDWVTFQLECDCLITSELTLLCWTNQTAQTRIPCSAGLQDNSSNKIFGSFYLVWHCNHLVKHKNSILTASMLCRLPDSLLLVIHLAQVHGTHPVVCWATWCQQEWNFWDIQLKLIMLLLADMKKLIFNYLCAVWITIWFYAGKFAS